MDFYKPVEKWEWVTPAELARQFKNISAEEIGWILAKIMKEEKAVQKKRGGSGVRYLLPIKWERMSNNYHRNVKYY